MRIFQGSRVKYASGGQGALFEKAPLAAGGFLLNIKPVGKFY
jgi:hypothetical protein